jgi:DNA mismatch endonuclease, patch repair protein
MADVHDKATRSYNMSRIRSKNTKPELLVRKGLFAAGFRFRLHDKRLPGKPDIVLPKYRTVVFVHGCFWHGHTDCKYFVWPKTKAKWWRNKIVGNQAKDAENSRYLTALGWRVIEVFECQLTHESISNTITDLSDELKRTVVK